MKGIWEHKWFMVPVGIFFGAGLLLAMLLPYGAEILALNAYRQEPLNSLFKFFSICGEPWLWVLTGLAALFWRFRFTLMIALAGFITPLVFILKDRVAVDRPITYFKKNGRVEEVVQVPGVELNAGQTSFPSGHTMSAFGLASLLALMAGKQGRKRVLFLALLAILVAISRVFLVQHFLVDVLGGALLGMGVSGLVWWLNGRAFLHRHNWLDASFLRINTKDSLT